ncbi:MAG: adenine phosphoribosyltransferase [Bacillota bacterium]
MDLKNAIRTIPDYPEKGILFRDITTLLKDPVALCQAVDEMQKKMEGLDFDLILGPESRGFIFSMPMAYNLKKGFVPVRKKGKLPAEVLQQEYDLEYGSAVIEMHVDAVKKGQKVVIVDDLLATGGTAKAMIDMIEKIGAEVVSLNFLIELEGLGGRAVLDGYKVEALLNY